MKKIGFLISEKKNEKRRALLPKDLSRVKNKKYLFFEKNYGDILGYSDADYLKEGVSIVSREEILTKDIICDPKIGDANYTKELENRQTIFGWVHAVQNTSLTERLVNKNITAYAWEEMMDRGRHVFWKNNELAGEAAVYHAYQLFGKLPKNDKVAIIGRGNTSRGAYSLLSQLGADVEVFDRKSVELLLATLDRYDTIINCTLWDMTHKEPIIYKKDLKKMKKNALIIDVSSDKNGAIESSRPTSFEIPMYKVAGIQHYAVDHTPSLFFKTSSQAISNVLPRFIDELVEDKESVILENACIMKNGVVLDDKITTVQKRF